MNFYNKYNLDFEKLKPTLIEGLVSVYGERHRKTIEKKLEKIIVNNYIPIEDLKFYIKNKIDLKKKLMAIDFLYDNNFITNEKKNFALQRVENLEGFLRSKSGEILRHVFDTSSFSPETNNLECFFSDNSKVSLTKRAMMLKAFNINASLSEMTNKFDLENLSLNQQRVKKAYEYIEKQKEEYQNFLNDIKEELDYIKNYDNQIAEINNTATVEYLLKISEFVPKDEKDKIKIAIAKFKEELKTNPNAKINYFSPYFSNSIHSASAIEAFTPENEALLKNNDGFAKHLKDIRLYYLYQIGIEGDNYDELAKNEDVAKLIEHASQIAVKISQARKFMRTLVVNKENKLKLAGYFYSRVNLNKYDFLCGDIFSADVYLSNKTYYNMNLLLNNHTHKPYQVGVINFPFIQGHSHGYEDVIFVHEVAHAVEADLIWYQNKKAKYRSGFDTLFIGDNLSGDENIIRDKDYFRRFEMLNEALHQLITLEVVQNLHNTDQYLISNKFDAKTEGYSRYELLFPMVKTFYNIFKEEILDAKMNKEAMEKFINDIGREEFEKLADLVTLYNNLLSDQTKNVSSEKSLLKLEASLVIDRMVLNYENNTFKNKHSYVDSFEF